MATATGSSSPGTERAQRADRILDAAGELLISWGYRKVTIEDVARRAGVGKGTVYLHFSTKETLFTAVVIRAQTGMSRILIEKMAQRPENIMPGELARGIFLSQFDSPIIHAIFTNDSEVLGTITETAAATSGELVHLRERVVQDYFRVLREHGLLRPDRSQEEHLYAFLSIVTGAMLSDSLLTRQAYPLPAREVRAEVLADTLHQALEAPATPDALRAAWPEVLGLFEDLFRNARAEAERLRDPKRE